MPLDVRFLPIDHVAKGGALPTWQGLWARVMVTACTGAGWCLARGAWVRGPGVCKAVCRGTCCSGSLSGVPLVPVSGGFFAPCWRSQTLPFGGEQGTRRG